MDTVGIQVLGGIQVLASTHGLHVAGTWQAAFKHAVLECTKHVHQQAPVQHTAARRRQASW